jgi:hypothetical protein
MYDLYIYSDLAGLPLGAQPMRTSAALLLLYAPLHSCTWSATDADAHRWYTESALAASIASGTRTITATTPLPVMCALVFRESHASWADGGEFRTQMMSTGASMNHSITLPESGATGQLVAFSWLPFGRAIFRSAAYELSGVALTPVAGSEAAVLVPPVDCSSMAPELELTSITPSSAAAALSGGALGAPVVSAFAFSTSESALRATTDASGSHGLARTEGAASQPTASLDGLSADTEYAVGAALLATDLTVTFTPLAVFSTPPSAPAVSCNVALTSEGASIASVSSSFGGAYSADKAIDGSDTTEWSSAGDGDSAWIEVSLAAPTSVSSVGFHSRSMTDGTSRATAYEVSVDGVVIQSCNVPDANALYTCDLSAPATGSTWRFDVTASTGGNTGAHTVAVYPVSCSRRRRLMEWPSCTSSGMGMGMDITGQVVGAAVGGVVSLVVMVVAVYKMSGSMASARRRGKPQIGAVSAS